MDWQNNRLWIGGVALLVLGGAAFYVSSRNSGDTPEDEIEAPRNFPEVDDADITSLEITRPDEEPVRLELREGTWMVVSPLSAPADQATVTTALDKLGELHIEGIAANTTTHHEELEVDTAHGVHVVASGADGELANLWIGATRAGNTLVRVEGEDQVVTVRGSIKFAFNKALREWRDRGVLDLESDDVIEMSWQGPNGTFHFTRPLEAAEAPAAEPEGEDGEEEEPAGPTYGEWQLTDVSYPPTPVEGVEPDPLAAPLTTIENFAPSRVRSMVTTLARMRASDFGDVTSMDAELNDSSPSVTLTVRDGASTRRVTVRLGAAHGEDGEHYAARVGNDTIFVISRHLSDRISPTAASFQQTAAAEAPPEMPEGMGGMPGMPPGGLEGLPPDVMRELERAMAGAGGGGHP